MQLDGFETVEVKSTGLSDRLDISGEIERDIWNDSC